MSDKGLTGIKETAIGFVGKTSGLVKTKAGKPTIKFDLACGENKPEENKYPTWRHCVAYGDKAISLAGLSKGSYVKVFGWVKTEALLDEEYHPVLNDGVTQLREYLILYSGEILEHVKSKEEQIPMFANA